MTKRKITFYTIRTPGACESRPVYFFTTQTKIKMNTYNTPYQFAIEIGADIANHESDLYVKCTPKFDAFVEEAKTRRVPWALNATKFRSNINGAMYLDIPFCFTPFWTEAEKHINQHQ